jgi:hypothetical protein
MPHRLHVHDTPEGARTAATLRKPMGPGIDEPDILDQIVRLETWGSSFKDPGRTTASSVATTRRVRCSIRSESMDIEPLFAKPHPRWPKGHRGVAAHLWASADCPH